MAERGEVYLVSFPGDFGKTRPAVVVQSDISSETVGTVTVCLMTSDLVLETIRRITVEPATENGLNVRSQVQADKIQTARETRLKGPIGRQDEETMKSVDFGLAFHLGLIAP